MLEEAGIDYNDLLAVAFYDKPFLKFERLLETYHAFAPRGLARALRTAVPVGSRKSCSCGSCSPTICAELGDARHADLLPEHHLSHAASAFYPSPFEDAAILTIDGVGEWATTTIGRGPREGH